jgi:hypothetical protein
VTEAFNPCRCAARTMGAADCIQLRRPTLLNVFLHRAAHARRRAPDHVEDGVRFHPSALGLPAATRSVSQIAHQSRDNDPPVLGANYHMFAATIYFLMEPANFYTRYFDVIAMDVDFAGNGAYIELKTSSGRKLDANRS